MKKSASERKGPFGMRVSKPKQVGERPFAMNLTTRADAVAVMGCVRRAAELLRRREPPASGRISQPTLFLEVDGLWVHLQSPEHRDEALPRFLYEQARKAASFELKLAALYAGKKEVAPGRYERGGLRLTCADLPPRGFRGEVWAMLSVSTTRMTWEPRGSAPTAASGAGPGA